mgnify:CR=1 FL=1
MAITAREKAQAAEALNRHPDLSPAARRLGIELLNRIDRRTGVTWPSEARLAVALGCCERTIRRAKVELRAAGLLSWTCRGQHKTPVYSLLWEALKMIGAAIKAKVKAAFSSVSIPQSTTAERGPERPSGRTFSSSYLTQFKNLKGALEGIGRPLAAKTHQQVLTDQQLNAKAHSRLWAALQSLSPSYLSQLIDRITEEVEAEAVKAERYSPGRGLITLSRLLESGGREGLTPNRL